MGHESDLTVPSPPLTNLEDTKSPPTTTPTSNASRQAATRRFRYRNDAIRDRDVLRYIKTWEDTFKPSRLHQNSLTDNEDQTAFAACPDTALAAFAQLAAIRMQTRRCLITLTCAVTEWVLADVGQRTSLQPSATSRNNSDQPWLGTSSFPRSQSLTHIALVEWRKARRARAAPTEDDSYYAGCLSEHSFIIQDLHQEHKYQALESVRHGPWIRYYCAIPLRDSNGSVLGSLTLLDDKPRYGVSADEMSLLENLSDTVVEHLSATLDRARRQRGERLISSLGLFHAGEDSLRDWWLRQDDTRVMNTGRNVDKGTAADRQGRVDAEFGLHPYHHGGDEDHESLSSEGREPHSYFGQYSDTPADHGRFSHSPVRESEDGTEIDGRRSTGNAGSGRTATKRKREDSTDFDLAKSTMSTYKRASNLLREALGADGVVFVDAGNVTSSLDFPGDTSTMMGVFDSNGNTGTESSAPDSSDPDHSDPGGEHRKTCRIQGVSIRNSAATCPSGRRFLDRVNMPEPYLQRLIHKFPRGFVCHFDQQGCAHNTSDESSSQSSSDEVSSATPRRNKDFHRLSKIFPGARILSAFPLRDDGSGRLRSFVFVWTTAIGRCFGTSEDLVFLKTFANSMSAEFSRLESIAADLSKATFITSISHELRSPLHGILAGAEFLHETPLTDFQLEMTHAISMAGRTLLDTVNHVLDYTKIKGSNKKLASISTRSPFNSTNSEKADGVDVETHTDLARLTEEVVETTVTAHRLHNGGFRPPLDDGTVTRNSPNRHPFSSSSNVSISLQIAHRKNWIIATQPGGWTRILTNLVGNAIKYTTEGHIAVRLSVDAPLESGLKTSQRCPVQFSVEDTGIGISDTFLAHGLFTPFKQENPYADGTGLGLSIVQQIARRMGAELDISSKLGEGTRAQVRFIAEFVADDTASDVAFTQDSLPDWTANMKVDQLQLLSGPCSRPIDSISALGSSVENNAQEWLGCEIVRSTDIVQGNRTSICGITESHLVEWQRNAPKAFAELLEKVSSAHSHIFVFATTMASVTLACGALPVRPVFIHQPIGPRKLLRAIASDRSSTVSGEQSEEHPAPLPTVISSDTARAVTTNKFLSRGRASISSESPSLSQSRDSRSRSPSNRDRTDTLPTDSSTGTASRGHSVASVSTGGISAGQQHSARGVNDTVLLVEDNEINMKFLIALLEKLNVPYECATNGLEAVQAYVRSPASFFLVLMDMSMPVMDGFAATFKIRHEEKRRKWGRTFIMALTGVTDAAERQRAYDSGVDDFQSKPVSMKHLKALIDARRQRT